MLYPPFSLKPLPTSVYSLTHFSVFSVEIISTISGGRGLKNDYNYYNFFTCRGLLNVVREVNYAIVKYYYEWQGTFLIDGEGYLQATYLSFIAMIKMMITIVSGGKEGVREL